MGGRELRLMEPLAIWGGARPYWRVAVQLHRERQWYLISLGLLAPASKVPASEGVASMRANRCLKYPLGVVWVSNQAELGVGKGA